LGEGLLEEMGNRDVSEQLARKISRGNNEKRKKSARTAA